MKITIWSKPNCQQCKAVYRTLDHAGVEYEVKDLTEFPEQLEAFKAADLLSAPVVVADGFTTFAGYNPYLLKAIVEAAKG